MHHRADQAVGAREVSVVQVVERIDRSGKVMAQPEIMARLVQDDRLQPVLGKLFGCRTRGAAELKRERTGRGELRRILQEVVALVKIGTAGGGRLRPNRQDLLDVTAFDRAHRLTVDHDLHAQDFPRARVGDVRPISGKAAAVVGDPAYR